MTRVVARRTALAGLLAVAAAACTGPTTSGQARTALTDALRQAMSAIETSDLTIGLLHARRLTTAVADGSLLDQLRVLEESSIAVTTLVPPASLGDVRAGAITAVAMASGTVTAARAWIQGAPGSAAELHEALGHAGDRLGAVLAEVDS